MTPRFLMSYILVNISRILTNLFETLIPFFFSRKTSVIAMETLGSDDQPNVGWDFQGCLSATDTSGSTAFLGQPGPYFGAVVVLGVSRVLFSQPHFHNKWWADGMCLKMSTFSVCIFSKMCKQYWKGVAYQAWACHCQNWRPCWRHFMDSATGVQYRLR